MKNTKEIQPILCAVAALSYCKESKNAEINTIMKYAIDKILDGRIEIIKLSIIGKNDEQIIDEVKYLLKKTTKCEL